MNNIAENLQKLSTAKTDIATAIINHGGIVNSNDGFEDFANCINSIPTGGGHVVNITTIPNANIFLTSSLNNYSGLSDNNGLCEIVGVEAGNYTVVVSQNDEVWKTTTLIIDNHPVNLQGTTISVTADFDNSTLTKSGDITLNNVYQKMSRCNVADDGEILCYYGDTNYTETGTNGQVMVKIPKFYYKLETTTTNGDAINYGTWSIIDYPTTGYKLHPAFINADGNEVDYFLISAFEAVLQDGDSYVNSSSSSFLKLASAKGNGTLYPSSVTGSNANTYAQNRGNHWYNLSFLQFQAVQMLFVVENGFNVSVVGPGVTYSGSTRNYAGQTTGNTTTVGTSTKQSVNWRGIENFWGNYSYMLFGFRPSSAKLYFCDNFNFSETTEYKQIAFNAPTTKTADVYAYRLGYDAINDWILFPKSIQSSRYKFLSSNCYLASSATSYDYCGNDSGNGLFSYGWGGNGGSAYSGGYHGARLMYV